LSINTRDESSTRGKNLERKGWRKKGTKTQRMRRKEKKQGKE
jgi:hypothetical protein